MILNHFNLNRWFKSIKFKKVFFGPAFFLKFYFFWASLFFKKGVGKFSSPVQTTILLLSSFLFVIHLARIFFITGWQKNALSLGTRKSSSSSPASYFRRPYFLSREGLKIIFKCCELVCIAMDWHTINSSLNLLVNWHFWTFRHHLFEFAYFITFSFLYILYNIQI